MLWFWVGAWLWGAACPHRVSQVQDGVVLWRQAKPKAGQVLHVTFASEKKPCDAPAVLWRGEAFPVYGHPHAWHTLLPFSADMPIGAASLEYVCGSSHTLFEMPVYPGGYPQRAIQVPPHFTEQAPPERAQQEQQSITALWSRSAQGRIWTEPFVLPSKTRRTSPFGVLRTYNGVKQSRHQGLDLDARVGTPVFASNKGTVAWVAENYYFVGNAVFIDHGDELFSMVFHLSHVDVHTGDKVEKGQRIGLAGKTGRASGPHVHFAVKLKGVYIDPETLLCATAR